MNAVAPVTRLSVPPPLIAIVAGNDWATFFASEPKKKNVNNVPFAALGVQPLNVCVTTPVAVLFFTNVPNAVRSVRCALAMHAQTPAHGVADVLVSVTVVPASCETPAPAVAGARARAYMIVLLAFVKPCPGVPGHSAMVTPAD